MSIALISDTHGNLPATQAVLADIRRRNIGTVYCLGDIAGKGPSSKEVFDLVEEACAGKMVYGNWDRAIVQDFPSEVTGFFRAQLGEGYLRKLAALPECILFDFCGQRIKLYHGRPTLESFILPYGVRNLAASTPAQIEAALAACGENQSSIVFLGDTHFSYSITYRGKILCNTGSVGNTCDELPLAAYTILHEQPGGFPSIEHVRLPYDQALAISQANACEGLPSREAYIFEIIHGNYGGRR